jgi:hypothetical protein
LRMPLSTVSLVSHYLEMTRIALFIIPFALGGSLKKRLPSSAVAMDVCTDNVRCPLIVDHGVVVENFAGP